MTSPLVLYAGALRRAARTADGALHLTGPDGRLLRRMDVAAWHAAPTSADDSLLARCTGPTLDIGCGPGRLTAELGRRGVPALGIDLSPAAVRLARSRGANVLLHDVFAPLPGRVPFAHVLLADGNIGIGGDPARLLARCRDLLTPGGTVLAEVDPPGTRGWRATVALTDTRRTSDPFAWAAVSAGEVAPLAARAGLRHTDTWTGEGRWFACLAR
ncbi:methyltransferase domain-containing protein [Catellatospora bangladeshensis]|uniref:Methyltransferase type 12 n=1 Tax=Catellatospora bangladeshensis TaxID=310355 RepID=A0A8J3JPJ2_9ACTN|nr:class I SAM-dependent methyltransferase [Catellatospora bangladeshensis]GIF84586.1 methyltransferase type 12 [Catellatospora bangladeshensis]